MNSTSWFDLDSILTYWFDLDSNWPDDEASDFSQLTLVTLTSENRQRLFQKAINASEESMENTRALMTRLKQYDPTTAQHFAFKDLTLSKAPFRLLREPDKLTKLLKAAEWMKGIVGLSDSEVDGSDLTKRGITPSYKPFDSFICLSYCWHSEDWKPIKGTLDNGWPISIFMFRAFLDQRASCDEGVWIDAVCIDQNNPTEKMHAIGSMDVVYKSARLTVIVLEDIILSNAMFAVMSRVLHAMQGTGLAPESLQDDAPMVFQALTLLFSSRWFQRAWCWHEVEMSPYSTFLVRTERDLGRLSLKAFSHMAYFIVRTNYKPGGTSAETHFAMLRMYHINMYKEVGDNNFDRSHLTRFDNIIDLKSSWESDKIAIAANLTGLQLCYIGPQVTHYQCRWILAMLALFAGDLAILCGNGRALQMTAQQDSSSWLRWSNETDDYAFLASGPAFPEHASIVSIHPKRIILGLLLLKDYTILVPSTKYTLIAESFLERHRDLKFYSEIEGSTLNALECSLECGLPWLLESMKFSKDIAKLMDQRIAGRDVWAGVKDMLIQAYPDHEFTITSLTNEQKRSVVQHIVFLLCYNGTFSFISEFRRYGAGNLPREPEPGDAVCYCVDWGGGLGKGLVFAKHKRLLDFCLAVPVALSGSRWCTLERLWALEPLDGPNGSQWRIRARTRLVTIRPLEEEGGLVLRAAQTVRG
jgi:Heterokaryon incompatibility protein (HET)